MGNRLRTLVALAAIGVALILGVLIGVSTGIVDRILGGPSPKTIATASLQSMRTENKLTVFAARYVSVVTSEQQHLGGLVSSERTLILPGDVRYELDLSSLRSDDVSWDGANHVLSVRLPMIDVAGPDVDINSVREYGGRGVLSALTNSNEKLDQANRDRAVEDLRNQATAKVPMQLAREAGRAAIERSFAMPLLAAGFRDVKVIARFPTDGNDVPGYIDLSTPYDEAVKEAERRRAAEGRK